MALDIDTIEYLLNQLPLNGLRGHALEFLGSLAIEDGPRRRLSKVLGSALQDVSTDRSAMSDLVDILSGELPSAQ